MKTILSIATALILGVTSASAGMIESKPIPLGKGLNVTTGINVTGGALGQADVGKWDFDQTVNTKSLQDVAIGFSNCGICPNPNGEGEQEVAVTGMLGNNTMLNTVGKQTFDQGDGPGQIAVLHQLDSVFTLDIDMADTPKHGTDGKSNWHTAD